MKPIPPGIDDGSPRPVFGSRTMSRYFQGNVGEAFFNPPKGHVGTLLGPVPLYVKVGKLILDKQIPYIEKLIPFLEWTIL
jgi:hypothetical protein